MQDPDFLLYAIRRVLNWRNAVGLNTSPVNGPSQDHAAMIASEDAELYAALADNDPVETIDALCDKIVFAIGAFLDGYSLEVVSEVCEKAVDEAYYRGYPLKEVFDEVMDSNDSKIIFGEEPLALREHDGALAKGISTYLKRVGPDMQVLIAAEGCTHPDFPPGKVVKPSTYRKPDIKAVLEKHRCSQEPPIALY